MTAVVTESKVEAIRAHMPAVHRYGYFNAGTNGPIPDVALQALVDAATAETDKGRIGPGLYEGLKADWTKLRETIAPIFGADASEISLTRSTSEGLNIALMGLRWEPGDEILANNLEHPSLFGPAMLLGQRQGVITRVVDIGNGGGDVVAQIEAAITRRTRVIAISHLQWSTGAIMPLKEISEVAHKHGALVIVDAAQSAGQIPVDVHDLGVDAYATPGQKWLCGPGGSGALYIAKHRMVDFKPTYTRSATTDLAGGFMIPYAGGSRYEMGELYNPAARMQQAALDFIVNEVGLDWAYARIKALGQRCIEGLERIENINILTPKDRMAGLVSFTIPGMTVQEVDAAVLERGYVIRYVDVAPCPPSARVSNSWWNTEEEVDGLVAAIADVAKSAADKA